MKVPVWPPGHLKAGDLVEITGAYGDNYMMGWRGFVITGIRRASNRAIAIDLLPDETRTSACRPARLAPGRHVVYPSERFLRKIPDLERLARAWEES